MARKTEIGTTAADEFKPFDREVEWALLGSIIKDNRLLAVASAELAPSDFYDDFNGRVFERMILFDEDNRPISNLTLAASMKNDPAGKVFAEERKNEKPAPTPEECIRDHLWTLADFAPIITKPPVDEYCQIIIGHRERREARDAITQAADALWLGDETLGALTLIVDVSDRIAVRAQHRGGSSDLGDFYEDLTRDVERAATGGKIGGLTTGLTKLDHQLGGFMPEDFIVLAGRPGMGKSILGCHAAKVAASLRDPVTGAKEYDPMLFSLEMSGKENAARIIADLDFDESVRRGRTPLHYSRIIKGRLSDEEFERYILLGGVLRDLGVKLFDEGRVTMSKIAGLARARAQLSPRKPLVIIDHLQIVLGGKAYRGDRVQELTDITGQCKALAKRLKCPVIALSQLNRGVEQREDKRPNLGDLRESGSIEQDADAVLFLFRPEYYLRKAVKHAEAVKSRNLADLREELEAAQNVLEIDVAKNRSGGTGDVRLFVDVAASAIRDKRPGDEDAPETRQLQLGGSEPLDGLSDLQKRTGP